MTGPIDPTPAQELLHRTAALRPKLPEKAKVTVDIGRFPTPDVPYLTVLKWAVSSDEDWPLLAERRSHLDETEATYGLNNHQIRQIVYDDLKRSLWRPIPDNVALTWDDTNLRLTLAWAPGQIPPGANHVFAALHGTIATSTTNLINAQTDSATALHQAIATATGPHHPPKPAFVININQLNLPADERYPGATNDERAEQLYANLETVKAYWQTSDPDAGLPPTHIRFFPATRTIEFDDAASVYNSGIRGDLAELAQLPQFSPPPAHPGAPSPGLLTFAYAEEGAELRAIEHAFATPGYRAHRQAQRRALNPGLTYHRIAQTYDNYDAKLSPESLHELDTTLTQAATNGKYREAFTQIFKNHGGLVIGESHDQPDAFEFVVENMANMKKAGLKRIICETFDQEYQAELDKYVFGREPAVSTAFHSYVQLIDENRGDDSETTCRAVESFLWVARQNGIQVVAAERPAAFFTAAGAGRITDETSAWAYAREKRLARYNWVGSNQIPDPRTTQGDLHIVGAAHSNTTSYGYPGISQLTGFPAVTITRDEVGRLRMHMCPEDRKCRLARVPTHASTTPTSPSSSTSHTTPSATQHTRLTI